MLWITIGAIADLKQKLLEPRAQGPSRTSAWSAPDAVDCDLCARWPGVLLMLWIGTCALTGMGSS